MITKRLSIVLVVALLVGVLSASGFAEIPRPWEAIDFGGETIHITTRWGNMTPLAPRGHMNWDDEDPRLLAHIAQVEEMFNVKIEIRLANGWDTLREDALAGEKNMDVFFVHTGLAVDLARDGYLIDLTDYLDQDYYAMIPPELADATNAFTMGAGIYGFAGAHRFVGEPFGLIYSQDIFEAEGLPDPYELWQAGEWTWDAFMEIARQATRDTTGDGEIDQWGYNHAYGVNYLRYWPASNGFDWIVEVDGQTNINLMDDRMVETLEFLHQLELEGLVGVGVPIEKQVMFAPNFVHILQNEPARADYRHSMVPLPKGPSADDNIVVGGGAVWGASIPITAKHNPRDIIEVVHALMQSSIPYIEYMNVYADLEDWQNEYWREREMISPDRRTFETWQWMESNIVQPFEPPIFGVTSAEGERIWNTLYNDVIIGGGSPSAVLGELQPVAEDLFAPYQERLYGGQ